MRIKIFPLFVVVLVCVFSAAGQNVVESESTVIIKDKFAVVSLAIDNSGKSASKNIELSILDPAGISRAHISQSVRLAAGKKKYQFDVPFSGLIGNESDEIAWYRLQYKLGDTSGIASLSELMRDDFDLRAAAFQHIIPGQTMRIRVRTLNPFTERAVKDVAVKVHLKIDLDTDKDEDELPLDASARTNGDGFAQVDFKIPDGIKPDGDGEITITGQKNGVVRKIEEDLDSDDNEGSVLMTTDKPLYQPGQTFNVRALYFNSSNTVVSDSELEFSIEDEDNTVLFRQTVKTSAFGIASVSWPIPDNAKLGSYHVKVEGDDDLRESDLYFKVSRYDLPNFTVTAKPDKPFYLPTDAEARITVNADYLFGKPVTKGAVRVVQESDRHWNYREQKYGYEEGESFEGTADSTGKYIANIDLRKEIADLQKEEWQRFKDISFAAYYTDLTTNRTEQRRFDIRLTKEPIHVYLIRYANQHPDLPFTGYLSTFYADGTPAVCDVEINDIHETVARIKTNSMGAGKFEVRIPRESIRKSEYQFHITARDKKGQSGTFDESVYLDDENDAIQIRTDQVIYKPGDTVEVDLRSTQEAGYIYVDFVKDWLPLSSQVVELHNGKAHLSIPYRPSFKGDVVIAAYSDKKTGRWSDSMRATRGIIFPEQQNLILDAKFAKKEYRPGEEADVKFSVLDGARKPVESAIGLGIFDKAIEERARTETEFGGYFSRFYRMLGYERSFGNITLKDLNDLDMSRPVSPEMQLAAEIILAGQWYYPTIYHSGNLDNEAKSLYAESVAKQLKPVRDALQAQYAKDFDHPVDAASLEHILSKNGIEFQKLRDPWGQPYVPVFSVNRTQDIVTFTTAAADKQQGTADDFNGFSIGFNYFAKIGVAIDRVATQYHNRTGRYIRDLQTLTKELSTEDIRLSELKDPWKHSYRITFEVSGRNYVIRFYSLGPNGYEESDNWRSDDFDVWRNSIDYFTESEQTLNRILDQEVNVKKRPFPRNEKDFIEMLRRNNVDIDSIKDGYGRSVYVTAEKESRYVDITKIDNGKTTITPATEEMMLFKLRTLGADGLVNSDDTILAIFSGAITEAHRGTGFAKVEVKTVPFSGAMGAITGTVIDPNGAVIPNAEVTATNENDESKTFTTRTNDEGKFLLGNLPSGYYSLRVSMLGFKNYVYQNIQIRSQSVIEVNATLSAAGVSETVNVTAEAGENQVNTTNASVSQTVTKGNTRVQFPYKEQTSTPRLREYFPETLVWQPELITDKKGRADLNFKMADNITTWKMFAIASTKKGKIGVVEKEVTAFQSFFADLDPPKFLTEGDEIYLPTQVRNYTEKNQKVDVTMDKADWFTFLGANRQQVNVASGASQNAVFGFKAAATIKNGKQRVTAIGQTDSDAIEKPVTVRPNGEEIVETDSQVFNGSADFKIDFPANALPNSQKAELKIYPNLISHVSDSVEGLLERPYGCGEQTISSTYPNLMILKFLKNDSALKQKAQKYLQKGYERLLGYQVADGGFSYWGGKDTSDIALTGYALRFLNDAKEFIAVDDDVIKKAESWLISQQKPEGNWLQRYRWENADNPVRAKLTTTYVVRSLAMLKTRSADSPAAGSATSPRDAAITKALSYLKQRNAEIDEPYALALFGLASLDAGDAATAKQVAAHLEKLAISEGSAVYWKLETNTPFYGWGTPGRIETTALVVQLLTRVQNMERQSADRSASDLVSKGLLFMLKNKDRYGVWYSTQTTINVLDSFLAILAGNRPPRADTIEVAVNGENVPGIAVAADRVEPITVDLSEKLRVSANSIDIRSANNAPIMAQTVATHYIDWRDSKAANVDINQSRALKLDYKCDKTSVAIMEDVTCTVDAERIGFRGYGMLLAEIGTPPGADVSRESLEAAFEQDWSLSRYDILPDRIIFYMWSKAGGTKFNFKFHSRYAINAQTPASIVYDYYNPEAQAKVIPLKFTVK